VKTFPTLYKKNSNGSIQQWTISVEGSTITKVYGQKDGKLQTTTDFISEGKNIGKKNETTPEEQALAEAEAQWTKKKTGAKGYVETISSAEAGESDALVEGGILPMLAKKFSEQGSKIVYPAYAQPKLDGIRCVAIVKDGVCTLWTRTRKPIVSMPHVVSAIEALNISDIILDGELYNHDYRDKFEEIVSLVRPEYVKPNANIVQYHIFDIVSDKAYELRLRALERFIKSFGSGPLIYVETIEVKTEEELMEAFTKFRTEGYEGAIVRNTNSEYVNKRSNDLQKIKEFDDAEFVIEEVIDGRGRMANKAIFTCSTDDGNQFSVKMEGSLERLETIYNNPHTVIGKKLTVRYQGYTNGNVPRFPIGISVRDYE
jgi:ATP-dependent DNA ligase